MEKVRGVLPAPPSPPFLFLRHRWKRNDKRQPVLTGVDSLTHEFVHYIPNDLCDGVLYVSIPFVTAVHLCCCGCGNQVVTPLDPEEWYLTFNGKSVSLHPSIGNWGLQCQSHYLIRRNQVVWLPGWFHDEFKDTGTASHPSIPPAAPSTRRRSFWERLTNWLRR